MIARESQGRFVVGQKGGGEESAISKKKKKRLVNCLKRADGRLNYSHSYTRTHSGDAFS